MPVLFDHSTPAPLRYALKAHTVVEAVERGWETLANGALLQEAEAAGFEVFITADKNIRYQQNLTRPRIAILVLENAQWPILRPHVGRVVAAVNAAHLAATQKSRYPTQARSGFFTTNDSKPCCSPELKRTLDYIYLACRSPVHTRASPYNDVHASA
jgi:hypothetical protein